MKSHRPIISSSSSSSTATTDTNHSTGTTTTRRFSSNSNHKTEIEPSSSHSHPTLSYKTALTTAVTANKNKSSTTQSSSWIRSKLSESSVLAPSFIPAQERQINLIPLYHPSSIIVVPSIPPLDDEIRRLNQSIVYPGSCLCHVPFPCSPQPHSLHQSKDMEATVPNVTCTTVTTRNSDAHTASTTGTFHSTDTTLWDHSSVWQEPNFKKLIPDFRFALNPTAAMWQQERERLSIIPISPNSPSLFEESSIADPVSATTYISRFETLLWKEYQEALLLYERYSQFHVPLEMVPPTTTTTDPLRQFHSSSRYIARMYIRGIADARPAIQPNDIVLLRPHQLPSQHPNAYPIMNGATMHSHMVEIHCRIVSIVRSKMVDSEDVSKSHFYGESQKKNLKNTKTTTQHHQHDMITITWISPQQAQQYPWIDFQHVTFAVRFIPSTTLWERSLAALHWTSNALGSHHSSSKDDTQSKENQTLNPMVEFLFPTQAPTIPIMTLPSYSFLSSSSVPSSQSKPSMDEEYLSTQQRQFVQMVLRRTIHYSTHEIRPPILLTGPAGTGKTRALLAAIREVVSNVTIDLDVLHHHHHHPEIQQHHKQHHHHYETTRRYLDFSNHRVLVCASSHTAADVITQRLSEYYDRTILFRLYDSDRPILTVPAHILPYTCLNSSTGSFTLPTFSSSSTTTHGTPNNIPDLLQYRIIVCTCSDAHILYRAGITNSTLRQRRQCFQNFVEKGLIHNNLTSIPTNHNQNRLLAGAEKPHFTHLFIDEAAQAMEPEILIPLSVVLDPWNSELGNGNDTSFHNGIQKVEVILVGDPRQLSPQVYSSIAAQPNGLGRPMIERLLRRPFSALGGGTQNNLLGPLCADNLNAIDDFVRYAFQDLQTLSLSKIGEDDDGMDDNSQLSFFLTKNYRGHASFLMMPSSFFYDDRLQAYKSQANVDEEDNMVVAHKDLNKTFSNDLVNASNSSAFWCEKVRLIESLSAPVLTSELVVEYDETTERLLSGKLLCFRKQLSWPMHFRGVIGKDISLTIDSLAGSNSWCNHEEANVVVDIVYKLCFEGRVSTEDVGIMAPYRAQVVLIRKLLRAKYLGAVNVGIVEDYQGMERKVIILSLTRSNATFVKSDVEQRMGLFHQPMRMNVALTRAENLFIVVGNPNIISKDILWRQWLWFCLRNGLWYGESGDREHCFPHYSGTDASVLKQRIFHVIRKLPSEGGYESFPFPEGASEASKVAPYVVMSSLERRMRRF